MRTTKPLAVLFASLLLFGAAACSSDSKDETSTDDATSQDDSSSSGDDSSSSGDDSSSSGDDSSSSGDDSSSSGDLDSLPLNLGDCLEVSLTYAGIYLSALGGEAAMDEALGDLQDLQGSVPESIQDDLDVIGEGMANADNLTDLNDFFDSDEYQEADANIQAYFEEECGG